MPFASPSHPTLHQSPTGDHKAKEQGWHTGACEENTAPATLPHTLPPAHPAPGLGEPSQPAQPDPNEPGCTHATGSSLQPQDQRMLPTLPGAGAGAAQDRSIPSTAPGQGGRAQPRSRGAAPPPRAAVSHSPLMSLPGRRLPETLLSQMTPCHLRSQRYHTPVSPAKPGEAGPVRVGRGGAR